jgi:hypothetical protein
LELTGLLGTRPLSLSLLEYQTSAYICQPGRRFRDEIKYLGFYKDKAVQREVARVLHRRDGVVFSGDEASKLSASRDEVDRAIGEVITRSHAFDWRVDEGKYQVFLLSGPEEEATLVLPQAIRNTSRGAWTQGQRYTSSAALARGVSTTDELAAEGC